MKKFRKENELDDLDLDNLEFEEEEIMNFIIKHQIC